MERRAVCLIICASLLLSLPSIADEMPDLDTLREERDEKLERYFMRALTQNRLDTAVQLLDSGEYAEARKKFESMRFARLNPRERSITYRYLAYAAVNMEDFPAGAGYYQKAIDEAGLSIDDEASLRFSIAQLYAAMEEWEQVEAQLRGWFFYVDKPNALAYYLLAISHYRRDQYEQALTPALKALDLSKEPKQSWLQLTAALYLQQEEYDSAIPILEELITRFPKKQYWTQLSLIFSAREDYKHAMEIQQLAYAQGLLTGDDELRRLARTYLFQQLPYPAAQVLERGLANGQIERDRKMLELLGNAWIAAREYEKAIEPLQQAAALADDGQLYLRLGQVRIQRENWTEATQLIKKAITKGGLDDTGKAHLLLGISYYSDDHTEPALVAFRRAQQHKSTRTEATAWLAHIERQSRDG